MTEAQKDTICTILGELKHDHENEVDCAEKMEITEKINACNILLGFPVTEKTHLMDIMKMIRNDETGI